jgi:hypothetical protein
MNATFFKEANGDDSSSRLIFIVGSIWNMAMSSYMIIKVIDIPVVIAFFTAVEAVFVALKLGQKPMESKKDNTTDL